MTRKEIFESQGFKLAWEMRDFEELTAEVAQRIEVLAKAIREVIEGDTPCVDCYPIDNMNELELLKLRLENAIEGHKICMVVDPNRDTADMLELLKDCYSVMCRIKPMDDDLK